MIAPAGVLSCTMDIAASRRDPHANQPLLTAGTPLNKAKAVLIMIHGRGATAGDILGLYDEIGLDGLSAVAPQAAGNTWYPQSFLAPLAANQPKLDSALNRIESLVLEYLGRGFASNKITLLGFSQGACLVSEFAAHHPRRYGAVMALTGGLIGPDGTPRNYPGSLEQTPVFLGSGDPDPHVPFSRVLETETVLKRIGAKVEVRRYAGMPHTINEDELAVCRGLLNNTV